MLNDEDFEATLEKFIAFKEEEEVSTQPRERRMGDNIAYISINTIANIITAIMAVLIVFKIY
jgi:hypothetical protein